MDWVNRIKMAAVVLSFSLIFSACSHDNGNALYESEFVQAAAVGIYGHHQADDVNLTVVFNTSSHTIVHIIYDPLAPENNTLDTREENVGRDDEGNYIRYLIPWRERRDMLLSGMIGLNALVLAEMTHVHTLYPNAGDVEFDGRTLDAVTGATMTRNSFINAVIEASRLYRDGAAQPSSYYIDRI